MEERKVVIKCNKSCKYCKHPCANSGKDLIPITVDELRSNGFVLCEDYTKDDQ